MTTEAIGSSPRPWVRSVRAFAMGALLFPLLDGLHTHWDVLAYTTPWRFRMAWWVPFEFGAMWVLIAWTVPMLERALGTDAEGAAPSSREIALETAAFAAVYASTAVFAPHALLLASMLLAMLALRLAWLSRRRDVVFVLASAALGPLGESIVSHTGAFAYAQPSFAGVPFWLPLLWAHGGFFARRWFRHPWFDPAA